MDENDLLHLKLGDEEAEIVLCGLLSMFADWDRTLKTKIEAIDTGDTIIVKCTMTPESVYRSILHTKRYLALIQPFADYFGSKLGAERESTLKEIIDSAQNSIDCLNQIYDEMAESA